MAKQNKCYVLVEGVLSERAAQPDQAHLQASAPDQSYLESAYDRTSGFVQSLLKPMLQTNLI